MQQQTTERKLSQKEREAYDKSIWLVGEIRAYQPVTCPFQLNVCTIVYDIDKFVSVGEAVLLTAFPLTNNWKSAYNRLLEYKLYLQELKKD